MAVIEQSDFSLGQVDDIYFRSTSQEQYLQALSVCTNAYISGQRVPVRRGSMGLIEASAAYPTTSGAQNFRTISFQTSGGRWYQVMLRLIGDETRVVLTRFNYKNNSGIYEPREQVTLAPVAGYAYKKVPPSLIDMTATDKYIVLATPTKPPQRILLDDDITKCTLELIKFSVVPSLDFGDLDYSDFQFHPKCTSASDPKGDPPVCPLQEVFGAIIDVTRPDPNGPSFNKTWIGGMIVGQTGASVQQPIGFGLITSIEDIDAKTQRFQVRVLQAFGATDYSKEGQAWSVREPVWGPDTGYPSKTTFFKGRLWFANTLLYPMLVCGSKENTPNNFNVGNGEPPDAICYILQNSEGGGIKHLFGGVNLHLFTDNQQLAVVGGIDVGITPGNFSPKVVSSFTTGVTKPIKYRNHIYFTTSDGKALVQIMEQDQSVAAQIISYTAQDLIKNPLEFAAYTIPSTQDQVLVMLNSDRTLTIYSYSELTGVSAFSEYVIGTLPREHVYGLNIINNTLYVILDNLKLMYSSSGKTFDGWVKRDIKDGVIDVSGYSGLRVGDILGVTYQTVRDDTNTHNYLGVFPVVDSGGLKIRTGTEVTGTAICGAIYSTILKTLPLFSGPTGSFKKRKVSQAWVQFYNSYNFSVNGRIEGLNLPTGITINKKHSLTGTARVGYSRGSQQDFFVEIAQGSPYDLQVQSISWAIKESLIA